MKKNKISFKDYKQDVSRECSMYGVNSPSDSELKEYYDNGGDPSVPAENVAEIQRLISQEDF